jgi:hypothetical protein
VENNARKAFAEIVGSTALLVGLYFTWSSVEVGREGQVTERFTKAIDQLGAINDKGEKQLEIRLGGIYALERIARDSEKDHWHIMEILTADLREHAPWPPKTAQLQKDNQLREKKPPATKDEILPKPTPDIQAVLTVLSRRVWRFAEKEALREDNYLDLADTDLREVRLSGAHLERAELQDAHLEGAIDLMVH